MHQFTALRDEHLDLHIMDSEGRSLAQWLKRLSWLRSLNTVGGLRLIGVVRRLSIKISSSQWQLITRLYSFPLSRMNSSDHGRLIEDSVDLSRRETFQLGHSEPSDDYPEYRSSSENEARHSPKIRGI